MKNKKNLEVEITPVKVDNGVILGEKNQILDPEQTGALLKDLQKGSELTAELKEWEVGESCRFFIVGTKKIKSLEDEDKLITCILTINEDGQKEILYDAVLRNNLLELAESGKPTPVEIVCTGVSSNKNRQYKTFQIFSLI